MANPFGAFVLTYLLAVVFTDELSVNLSSVSRLVAYQKNLDFTEVIPGALYNGTIAADWAVPPSALSGLDGQVITVKVTASVPENSSVFFPASGAQAKEATRYLQCRVANGACANGSVLSATIPIAASARPDEGGEAKITLRSEIVSGVPASYQAVQQDVGAIFESLKNAFLQNATAAQNGTGGIVLPGLNITLSEQANGTQNGSGNFLDSLKPEGNASDPLSFLEQNPLISIFALIIVIVITGAYLLNSKD